MHIFKYQKIGLLIIKSMSENKSNFISLIKKSLDTLSFVKISLGNYKGKESDLNKILIKQVVIKNDLQLSFTYRYKTRDIVKNYSLNDSIEILDKYLEAFGFRIATLFTVTNNHQLEFSKKGKSILRKLKPTITSAPSIEHDHQKNRKIDTINKPYLHELGLLDKAGSIYKSAQNKYKQINHYIELLSTLLDQLPDRKMINVVDMGAGKGYLTFALYDYLTNELKRPTSVIGIEYREDLVNLCNRIADKSKFKHLQFIQGTIEDYENSNIDVLIALHACDTATDDAIYKGINNNADLIVVAPCCHKQIRRQIEKYNVNNEVDFLTKYGIFLERQAEMVTDGIRSLILEYFGYKTKVFEFISDAHTPKNVLIVGAKKKQVSAEKKADILNEIKKSKAFFGIEYHHLEIKMGLDKL